MLQLFKYKETDRSFCETPSDHIMSLADTLLDFSKRYYQKTYLGCSNMYIHLSDRKGSISINSSRPFKKGSKKMHTCFLVCVRLQN